jgi:D-amino peptidase
MKVFLSVDMEGATGVTSWAEVSPNKPQYERFRKFLTGDVKAAVEGAFQAGATEVLVNEAHDGMRNILLEEVDPRVRIITGFEGKKLCMMQGIDDSFDAAFLISYHAKAGTDGAILNHTLTGAIHNFWINGVLVGESGISAALAGYYGVPVVLITGDDKVAREANDLLGHVETAIVKEGLDRYSAKCMTPQESREMIKKAATTALENIDRFKPYKVRTPVKIEVEFTSPSTALLACTIPSVVREGPRKISFSSENVIKAWEVIWPSIRLGMSVEARERM